MRTKVATIKLLGLNLELELKEAVKKVNLTLFPAESRTLETGISSYIDAVLFDKNIKSNFFKSSFR